MGCMKDKNSMEGAGWMWLAAVMATAVTLAGCAVPAPAPASPPSAATTVLEVAQPDALQPPMVSAPPQMPPQVPPPAATPVTPAAVTEPVARRRPTPRYPPSLADSGQSGRVVVSFTIGAKGQPEDVRVESSSHALFTKEVMAVLPGWRFDPARDADGGAVRTRMRVPFSFRLDDSKNDLNK